MKMIKMALLGGAALAVSTAAARADDLSDLKAQVEALNARVAQMEAAPSVPDGYNLLTMTKGPATVDPFALPNDRKGLLADSHKVGILPTADAPAAASIEWSGYVYAIVGYAATKDKYSLDVWTRAQLQVVAKTDTSVGEVGVEVRLRADSAIFNDDNNATRYGQYVDKKDTFRSPKYWGWWSMTPEITFGGGYAASQAANSYIVDSVCTCWWVDASQAFWMMKPDDVHQMALMYKSGPVSASLGLEDTTGFDQFSSNQDNSLGVSANIKFSGDTVSGGLFGLWRDGGDRDDSYIISAGLGFNLDPFTVDIAGGGGHTSDDIDFWNVTGFVSASLSDEIHGEIGAAYLDQSNDNPNETAVLAGIYYAPVDQLTIGLEGEYDFNDGAPDVWYAGFVSVWSF